MSGCLASLAAGLPAGPAVLGAAGPLEHVLDGRLFFDRDGSLFRLGITKQTALFFLAGILTILFFASYARRAGRSATPSRWGNFVEFILDFIRDQMVRPFLGRRGDKFVPLLACFFVYILCCNLMGLVPFFDFLGHGGNTATGNIGITAGLAISAAVSYHALGIREQGCIRYVRSLFPKVPIFVLWVIVPVELVTHVVRPFALAVRLFANMVAGHTLVAAVIGFTAVLTKAFIVPGAAISLVCMLGVTALTFLELLVALIQAFVFTFLTTVYISGAVHPEH